MKKISFAFVLILMFTTACFTPKEPFPTKNPATEAAIEFVLTNPPTKTSLPPTSTPVPPTATSEPTRNPCVGLSPVECAHSGTHDYSVVQELAFSDCLPVYTVGTMIPHNYIFSAGGLTIEGFENYPLVKVAENVYESPDPEFGYNWRFTFTADSVIEDVPFKGQPCTQTTWSLVKP